MDHIPAEPSEVQVTRPTLTVPRRSKMYDYCPEERPGGLSGVTICIDVMGERDYFITLMGGWTVV